MLENILLILNFVIASFSLSKLVKGVFEKDYFDIGLHSALLLAIFYAIFK